ncbi:MAG: hypothetical protein IAG10_01105 [Planctomycetaceae bacterium]|nr:hypothetical protein [Planctomycetaceae bacterium]
MTDDVVDDRDNESFSWGQISAFCFIVLLTGLLIGVLPWFYFAIRSDWHSEFPQQAGLWGDSFGFVNAMLSALGFAGVLVTVWMQRKELKLQRFELKMTREEHRRMAEAQEESEKRLLLSAYVSALESLRQLSQWRMTADPARYRTATFPVVHGLVIQARVTQSLHTIVRDMEPELCRIHNSLKTVTEVGSHVWQLEQFLAVYLSLRGILNCRSQGQEAENQVQIQVDRLSELKKSSSSRWQRSIDAIIQLRPQIDWNDFANAEGHFQNQLAKMSDEVLHLLMSLCYE